MINFQFYKDKLKHNKMEKKKILQVIRMGREDCKTLNIINIKTSFDMNDLLPIL
jgi:hypothetical protein